MTNHRGSRLLSEKEAAHPMRRFTAEDVYASTGITVVTHLALSRRFYLTQVEGRWVAFVSSLQPERHSEIFEVLITVGPLSLGDRMLSKADFAATVNGLLSL